MCCKLTSGAASSTAASAPDLQRRWALWVLQGTLGAAGGRKRQGRWALWVLQGTLGAAGGRKPQGRWALWVLQGTLGADCARIAAPVGTEIERRCASHAEAGLALHRLDAISRAARCSCATQ